MVTLLVFRTLCYRFGHVRCWSKWYLVVIVSCGGSCRLYKQRLLCWAIARRASSLQLVGFSAVGWPWAYRLHRRLGRELRRPL
jgi:hypothetical protein